MDRSTNHGEKSVVKNRLTGIIVLGPFRSGTSLVSRILSKLGVGFGPREGMLKADRFNPDGYFQHKNVRIANNRLIKSAGTSVAWPAHPQLMSSEGDLAVLKRAKLDWTFDLKHWGVKDPRFCATLLSWISADRLDPLGLSIVRVERDIEAAALDLLGMPELARQLPARTARSAIATIGRYAEFAEWHTSNLQVPGHVLRYEALLANPAQCVADLSDFVHAGTKQQIKEATACIRRQGCSHACMDSGNAEMKSSNL